MAKDFKFMTLNLEGLRNVKKNKTLFKLIKEDQKVAVLQETWPRTIHLSTGTSLINIFGKKSGRKQH